MSMVLGPNSSTLTQPHFSDVLSYYELSVQWDDKFRFFIKNYYSAAYILLRENVI